MAIKEFEEYIARGIVKKQLKNKQRSLSLIKEAEEKKDFLKTTIKNIPAEKMNANFIIDYCYDILMELIRSKMYADGYNAENSHEAEVSYLKVIGFSEADLRFIDELRYNRNGIKYYGIKFEINYANKVKDFMERLYVKLIEIIKNTKL